MKMPKTRKKAHNHSHHQSGAGRNDPESGRGNEPGQNERDEAWILPGP